MAGEGAADVPARPAEKKVRDNSLDLHRGIICAIMALDHVRSGIAHEHATELWNDKGITQYDVSSLQSEHRFIARFVTHLCATGFELSMGIGISLVLEKRSLAGDSMRDIVKKWLLRGAVLAFPIDLLNRWSFKGAGLIEAAIIGFFTDSQPVPDPGLDRLNETGDVKTSPGITFPGDTKGIYCFWAALVFTALGWSYAIAGVIMSGIRMLGMSVFDKSLSRNYVTLGVAVLIAIISQLIVDWYQSQPLATDGGECLDNSLVPSSCYTPNIVISYFFLPSMHPCLLVLYSVFPWPAGALLGAALSCGLVAWMCGQESDCYTGWLAFFETKPDESDESDSSGDSGEESEAFAAEPAAARAASVAGDREAARKRAYKPFLYAGLILLALWASIRPFGFFGNTQPMDDDTREDWIVFLNDSKYPPSIAFLCLFLGMNCLLMWLCSLPTGEQIERAPLRIGQALLSYGRVPLFYYFMHAWVILIVRIALAPIFKGETPQGLEYIIWLLLLLVVIYPCNRYHEFKLTTPRDSGWRLL